MKRIGILAILATLIMQVFSQAVTAETGNTEEKKQTEETQTPQVVVGDKILTVTDSENETNITIGNRKISILESLEGKAPKIEFNKITEDEFNWQDEGRREERERRSSRFRGHWSGIEFGFNNYNHIADAVLPDAISYMKLNSAKSNSFNLNFSQISLGITRHIGIVTGLGLNWNNYVFANDNNIEVGPDDYIIELLPPAGTSLKKSKFTTLYLNVPAMLEIQLPTGEGNRLNIAAGVIGGIKLGSHTKMKFDSDQKIKSNDELNLCILRGGVTARVGYENFMLYGTYHLTDMFRTNKGPGMYQLEPFEIGFAFTFND
jgi:hypothetical protein